MVDREAIIESFGGLAPEEAHDCLHALRGEGVELLRAFLNDLRASTEEVRTITILRILGTLSFVHDYHDPATIEGYLEFFQDGVSAHVRATWVKNLGKIGGPGEAERILAFLDDRDPRVRANAVEGLAFLVKRTKNAGGPKVLERLQALLRSSNPRLRINAALALFFVHRLEAEGLFCYLRRLAEDGEPVERQSAQRVVEAFALRREGSTREALAQFGEDSIYYLLTRYDLDFFD